MISINAHPSRPSGRFFVGLAGIVLLLVAPGCGMSRLAANRIIAAPNQHQRGALAAWSSVWTNLLSKVTTNPLVTVTITSWDSGCRTWPGRSQPGFGSDCDAE